jgi:hypothetical protein
MQVIGGFCGEDVCECASYDRNKGNSVHKAPLGTNIVRLKPTRCKHLDAGIVALLAAERRKHQQIMAGIPDGADIDLTLIKLPEAALIFPADLDARTPTFTKTRVPRDLSKNFRRIARKLGFAKLRFHNLQHSHSTILLNAYV